ncbi:ABC transporter permease [Streptomyces acidiscabies]|uniref:ABC transporter permease n=1 Tax=Streptomyces acidiscabies TaxID=42234 RepID=A0A0L0K3B6_9ACTN|nr:ABC transporter permease [Streptomyces acidiscabies]MBP5937151.1 ABC transporter permease [Streptomyces sp. LBUM 1476]KND32264.1 ABC transporter permease [Streptomyces acidiscabies]MBZ3914800.1 ABC transporter permease [Streptomyces acidiscabies]MDX2960748.1 ABC transporter permease [Streptomyces acidiscabies]MDX3020716.1 ABC transporter permease [Streptomyces acidiscabies]
MGRYAARRLLQAIPVLIGVTFIIFCLVFALPGDPIQALAGEKRADPNIAAMLREQYHLNEPLYQQYWHYISGVFTGDLGQTYNGREISDIVSERFPVTLKLALTSFAIEAVIGIVAGIFSALKKGRFIDNVVLISTLVLISIPVFVLGSVLQLELGVNLKITPVAGIEQGWPQSYILPAIVLASTSMAYIARLTRTSMGETIRADYVRTAVAKGLPRRRVIGVHALRNSLIPVVTFLGMDLGALMGGAIITERVFNLPGLGGQIAQSVYLRERPVVVGLVTLLVLIYLVANLLVDLLYAVLDPRIRYE